MYVVWMQHYDSFQVRIHQLTPDLTDVGTSLDEAKTLRQEHQELVAKLHVSTAVVVGAAAAAAATAAADDDDNDNQLA